MTNTQTIRVMNELADAVGDIFRTWELVSPDLGHCSRRDAAEVTLDHLEGPSSLVVDDVINRYGYEAVVSAIATNIL